MERVQDKLQQDAYDDESAQQVVSAYKQKIGHQTIFAQDDTEEPSVSDLMSSIGRN
jgi:hypothetical protein